jgi:hypothetical protein
MVAGFGGRRDIGGIDDRRAFFDISVLGTAARVPAAGSGRETMTRNRAIPAAFPRARAPGGDQPSPPGAGTACLLIFILPSSFDTRLKKFVEF